MAASKTYRTTGTRSTSSTTATYNSVAIGDAAEDRYVIIGVTGEPGAEGDEEFSSVTINGNSMGSPLVTGFETTNGTSAALYILLVPTGTTCDIVVTSTGSHLNNYCHVWTATGIDPTLFASTSNGADPLNINANVPLGGVAFACGHFDSTTAVTTTGLTEDYDVSFDASRGVAGSYGPAGSAETPRTFTFDGGAGAAFGCVVVFEEAAGAGAYTLTADVGSYSITGVAAGLKRGLNLVAAAGSYAITGVAAGLKADRKLACAAGSYSITGNAAGLAASHVPLAADPGVYSITGNAAGLRRDFTLTAAAGSYAITGVAAGVRAARSLTAAAGSYAVTGYAAGVVATHAPLAADTGSYAITGYAAGLRRDFTLAAAAGSYAITGVAAGLAPARKVVAETGSYAITGYDAGLLAARKLIADAGSYAITGVAASLTYGAGNELTADAGAYSITGYAAGLAASHPPLIADAGAYEITGYAAGLVAARKIVAEAGAYTVTGVAAGLRADRRLTADAGAYTVTGVAAGLAATHAALAAVSGVYSITGYDAGLRAARILAAEAGAYAITGVAADLVRPGTTLTAAAGSYAITGNDATLTYTVAVLGTPIQYAAIKAAIKAAIEAQLGAGYTVSVDEGIEYADKSVGIFLQDRAAEADLQTLFDARRTTYILTFKIECWRFAMSTAEVARLRFALAGSVELALMLDRTFESTCETSWIEGGRFLTQADPKLKGAFWAGAEITLSVKAQATVA